MQKTPTVSADIAFKIGDPDNVEAGLNTAKRLASLLASSLPIVGPIVYECLSSTTSKMQEGRIQECLDQVALALEILPKEILQTEYFADVTWRTLKAVTSESNASKRIAFANIYRQCLKKLADDNVEGALPLYDLCLRTTENLSDISFKTLALVDTHINSGKMKTEEWRFYDKELSAFAYHADIMMAMSNQTGIIAAALSDLISRGLLWEHTSSFHNEDNGKIFTTEFADMYIKWITDTAD